MADRAAVRFRESMSLPVLGSLAGEQPESVDDVLASYDHSNTINLFALGALVAWLRGEVGRRRARRRSGRACRRRTSCCPSSPQRSDVRPKPGQLVLRLNRFGDPAPASDPGQHVPPSRACAGVPAAAGSGVGAGRGRRLARAGDCRQSRATRMNAQGAGARDQCGDGRARARRSKPASRPSSITPSARWSRSAARSAWRVMLFRTASVSVRHEGAYHQWRKDPPREKSIRLVADERYRRITGGAGAS